MFTWLRDLDRILRGDATRPTALRRATIELPVAGIAPGLIVLAMVYGACMGLFGILREDGPNTMQLVASTVKVPLLFFLTVVVTFPSLYVFNALVGSRLSALAVLRLLVAAGAVNIALLASFGPIVAFFSASTTSYPFILLLNVVAFAIAGGAGLRYMLQTLHRLSVAQAEADAIERGEPWPPPRPVPAHPPMPPYGPPPMPPPAAPPQPPPQQQAVAPAPVAPQPPAAPQPAVPQPPAQWPQPPYAPPVQAAGPLDHVDARAIGAEVRRVFRVWVVAFALVGAQMGWVLRPFVGTPDRPFSWFRGRESSFFEGLWWAIRHVFQ